MLRGNLLIGQSGGPTPVINASLSGAVLAAQRYPQIEGIYGMVHGIEGALKDELVDLNRESRETIENLIHTPASALGSCRHKINDAEYERILSVCRAHNIRHFVYIGGNDSMDTCRRISDLAQSRAYEMQIIGVPKTIDNDLAITDHCPGFGSAARFLALATRDTGLDMEAMATFEDVIILEAMGRNAGWLAAASALAKSNEVEAPHLVYVPELAIDEQTFLDDVARVHARLGRVFVVVCEGVRAPDGQLVGAQRMHGAQDAFGHTLATLTIGVAAYLAELVTERLRLRARFLRPVLIGRTFSACVSEVDRREAYLVGEEAVQQLANDRTGVMITLERTSNSPYGCQAGMVALDQVANVERLLPREYLDETGRMPNARFREYALPLIGGALGQVTRLQNYRLAQLA